MMRSSAWQLPQISGMLFRKAAVLVLLIACAVWQDVHSGTSASPILTPCPWTPASYAWRWSAWQVAQICCATTRNARGVPAVTGGWGIVAWAAWQVTHGNDACTE